ncbi:MAG: 1,4-alpha-glucan branching protein GlgB [Gemmatimonadota bacterium]|nr:1,4-alpha-glucan branching protein GlgB [Gemmatimonadota bacterium]
MPDVERLLREIVEGRCAVPFDVLGNHPVGPEGSPGRVVRAYLPWAEAVWVARPEGRTEMRAAGNGLFAADFPEDAHAFPYRLQATPAKGEPSEIEDPYRFPPVWSADTLERLREPDGRVHEFLGAHPMEHEGVRGTCFAVWAPWAAAVCVVGDFNGWVPWLHPLRAGGESGVWELFLPNVGHGGLYKFLIRSRSDRVLSKTDPCARAIELRPQNASRIVADKSYTWEDGPWMEAGRSMPVDRKPASIYEVHLGSWKRKPGADARAGEPGWLNYAELADELLPYVKSLGFTHIELLPITEHPLDESWGYQTTGYFAPTARYGDPDQLRSFVDRAHALGIGVILDWVPAHFPMDAAGLGNFDGTHLYEHADPRKGAHPDWGTYIFNLARPEVISFLVSSTLFWIEEFHIDGLRLDAVASMLYLDYSRKEGEWIPNPEGGRENHEAVRFLQVLNEVIGKIHPDVWVVAEESTAWPRVSHPVGEGGLGFGGKWNMGWMHDTLEVMELDPLFRKGSFDKLTFSILYAFSERFILPLSHDEVVHLKGSLARKMPGTRDQKLANLRTLFGYMWAHPGKKLLFMGGELGEWREWDHEGTLDWSLLDHPRHRGLHDWVAALNRLYAEEPALHETDWDGRGFEWLDCHDRDRTVLSFLRWGHGWTDPLVVIVNLTPQAWEGFRVALPFPGSYRLLLDSDSLRFGGTGTLEVEAWDSEPLPLHSRDHSLELTVPPLGVLFLKGPAGQDDGHDPAGTSNEGLSAGPAPATEEE